MEIEIGRLLENRYKVLEEPHLSGSQYYIRCSDQKLEIEVQVVAEFAENQDIRQYENRIKEIMGISRELSGINRIIDYFVDNSLFCYVEETRTSKSLSLSVAENAMTENDICLIMKNLCQIVCKLHENNIICCNISPDTIQICGNKNVVITEIDYFWDLRYKIPETKTVSLSKCIYEAPEKCGISSEKITVKTDIYCVGMSMIFAYSKQQPLSLSERLLEWDNELLESVKSILAEKKVDILKKAVALKPNERIQTIADFIILFWEDEQVESGDDSDNAATMMLEDYDTSRGRKKKKPFKVIAAISLALLLSGGGIPLLFMKRPVDNFQKENHKQSEKSALKGVLDLDKKYFLFENYSKAEVIDGTYGCYGMELPTNTLAFLSNEKYRGISKLNLSGMGGKNSHGITSLAGIDVLADSLEELDLSSCNDLTDISDITKLKKLRRLNLNNSNKIQDYSYLMSLDKLEVLSLSSINNTGLENNRLSVIMNAVINIPNLKELDISDNNITDISFLQDAKKLEVLNLSGNSIANFTTLAELKNLDILDISNTEAQNFEFLESLDLRLLSTNTIRNLNNFSHMENLQSLTIENDKKLEKLDGLEKLKSLREFNLMSDEKITDFSSIKKLSNLEVLNLYNTAVSDLSFLKELLNVESIVLSCTKINNLDALAELKKLKILNCSDVKNLESISGLRNLNLEGFRVTNAPLTSLQGLEGNNNLKVVDCCNCKVKDYSILKTLPKLRGLTLEDCDSLDIGLLEELSTLKTLNISSYNLSEEEFSELEKKLPDCIIKCSDYHY